MSHNVESRDSLVFDQEFGAPWHRKNFEIYSAMSPQDAYEMSSLNFQVEVIPATVPGGSAEIDGLYLVRRTSANGVTLAVDDPTSFFPCAVKTRYEAVQYSEIPRFGEALLEASGEDIKVASAGTLKNGARGWMLFRLPTSLLSDVDPHEIYLLVASSHDGTLNFMGTRTAVRVQCDNTLTWAVQDAKAHSTVKIPHTKGAPVSIAKAREILSMTGRWADAMDAEIRTLLDVEFTNAQFEQLAARLTASTKKAPTEQGAKAQATRAEKIQEALWAEWKGERQANIAGTAYCALNAVSSWDLWERRVKGDRSDTQVSALLTGGISTKLGRVKEQVLIVAGVLPERTAS